MTDFNVTVTFTYSVSDEAASAWYGTTDPIEMAAIDETNWRNSAIELGAQIADGPYTVTVTPAEPAA